MRLLFAALVAILLSPASLKAETVGIDLSKFPIGTQFISVEDDGDVWTRHLAALDGDLYKIEIYRGPMADSP